MSELNIEGLKAAALAATPREAIDAAIAAKEQK